MSPKKLINRAWKNDGLTPLTKWTIAPNAKVHYIKLRNNLAGLIVSEYLHNKSVHIIDMAKIENGHCVRVTDRKWIYKLNKRYSSYLDALATILDIEMEYPN